jgi:hypothetical protein
MKRIVPALMTLLGAWSAGATQPAPVLVELFTSQGCNSCPAADGVLAELAGRPDVLPLAFHVTYWDRLGWKDTLGDERWTERQRDYARLLGNGQVYTPQAIIAGVVDRVGSRREEILDAIGIVRRNGTARSLVIDDAGRVDVRRDAGPEQLVVWAAAWDRLHRVEIERGENAGRRIDYHHVVRWLETYPAGGTMTLPLDLLRRAGHAGVAVVVQRRHDGTILAIGQQPL